MIEMLVCEERAREVVCTARPPLMGRFNRRMGTCLVLFGTVKHGHFLGTLRQ